MTIRKHHIKLISFILCAFMVALSGSAHSAVVSRTNSKRPSSASRVPTMSVPIQTQNINTSGTGNQVTPEPEPEAEPEPEEEIIIEDKTSQFDEILQEITDDNETSDILAEQIRLQRAALDNANTSGQKSTSTSKRISACDFGLRKCMQQKCGDNFTKCSGDTDTTFGTKLDACRRDVECTGHEYTAFTEQIKADRDANAKIALYNSIIECGQSYNNCIMTECGTTFSKCLGKRAGDQAISKCDKIARECRKNDSGLSARIMNVFGTVRMDAESAVQRDEKRLYELRDAMASACKRLGAMFDERSLDCVYTVNFFAGDKNTLYASKKAYAGSVFSCNQNWFGVDITTFKENAFRATREQSSATSAFMGAGLGTAVGAVTSGAVGRAIERTKAENELRKAKKEYEENYGTDNSKTDNGDNTDSGEQDPATGNGDNTDNDEQDPATGNGDNTDNEEQDPATGNGDNTDNEEQDPATGNGDNTDSGEQDPATGNDDNTDNEEDDLTPNETEESKWTYDDNNGTYTYNCPENGITVTFTKTAQGLEIQNSKQQIRRAPFEILPEGWDSDYSALERFINEFNLCE